MSKRQVFNSYALPGDCIEWEKDGFTLRATLLEDYDTTPDDSDCYSTRAMDKWLKNEWFFAGVVISVSRAGVVLDDAAASLWGCGCNLGRSNKYLTEAAHGLGEEALSTARATLRRLLDSTDPVIQIME